MKEHDDSVGITTLLVPILFILIISYLFLKADKIDVYNLPLERQSYLNSSITQDSTEVQIITNILNIPSKGIIKIRQGKRQDHIYYESLERVGSYREFQGDVYSLSNLKKCNGDEYSFTRSAIVDFVGSPIKSDEFCEMKDRVYGTFYFYR